MSADAQWKGLVQLRQVLSSRFDLEELRTLCHDLDVDFDDLPAQGKSNKARELVAHLARRNQLGRLLEVGQEQRPDVSWSQFTLPAEPAPAVTEELLTRLHEKRAEALTTLFGQIVEVESDLRAWAYLHMPVGLAPETVEAADVLAHVRELTRLAQKARIFLGQPTIDMLDQVLEEIRATAADLERREMVPGHGENWSAHVSALDRLFASIPRAMARLETEIRQLLGVT
jgi:hypothetical protein